MTENEIGKIVVDAAIAVHRALGPGLLVPAYSDSPPQSRPSTIFRSYGATAPNSASRVCTFPKWTMAVSIYRKVDMILITNQRATPYLRNNRDFRKENLGLGGVRLVYQLGGYPGWKYVGKP